MNNGEKTVRMAEQAQRIKEARKLAGFATTKAFHEAHPELSINTLRAWESSSNKPLSTAGAIQLAKILSGEGLYVTPSWLLNGSPPEPVRRVTQQDNNQPVTLEAFIEQYDKMVSDELKVWVTKQSQAVSYILPDNSMMPVYESGDCVAGLWVQESDWSALDNQSCIVQLQSGQRLCRQLIVNHGEGAHLQLMALAEVPGVKVLEKNPAIQKIALIYKTFCKPSV